MHINSKKSSYIIWFILISVLLSTFQPLIMISANSRSNVNLNKVKDWRGLSKEVDLEYQTIVNNNGYPMLYLTDKPVVDITNKMLYFEDEVKNALYIYIDNNWVHQYTSESKEVFSIEIFSLNDLLYTNYSIDYDYTVDDLNVNGKIYNNTIESGEIKIKDMSKHAKSLQSIEDSGAIISSYGFSSFSNTVDKSNLETLIMQADSLHGDNYTKFSFSNLSKAKEEAINVVNSTNVTMDDVNIAISNLSNAIDNLVRLSDLDIVDKSALSAILEEGDSLLNNKDLDDHVIEELQSLLSEGYKVKSDKYATQIKVDSIVKLIKDKINEIKNNNNLDNDKDKPNGGEGEEVEEPKDIDETPPIIQGVYLYKGKLYIQSKDIKGKNETIVSGLNKYSKGIKFIDTDIGQKVYPKKLIGQSAEGKIVTLNKLKDKNGNLFDNAWEIPSNFELYTINDELTIADNSTYTIGVSSIDANRNRAALTEDDVSGLSDIVKNMGAWGVADDSDNELYFIINKTLDNNILWENEEHPLDNKIKEQLEKENQIDENIEDKQPPVVLSAYVIDNVLYTIIEDNIALADKAYGFEWLSSSSISSDIVGGDNLVIEKGSEDYMEEQMIYASEELKGVKIFKSMGIQEVSEPSMLTIYGRDWKDNEVKKNIAITLSDEIIFGEEHVPPHIKDIINKNNGGENSKLDKEDGKPPVITSVYMYNGKLHVEGYSPGLKLKKNANGWNPLDDMIIKTDYIGETRDGRAIKIPAGDIIPQFTRIYTSKNSQEILVPMMIEVSLIDSANQETKKRYYIDRDNWLYDGEMPNLDLNNSKPVDGEDDIEVIKPTMPPVLGGPVEARNTGGAIVKVNKAFKDIDWDKNYLVFKVYESGSEELVYKTTIFDIDKEFYIPRLPDATDYTAVQEVVRISDGFVVTSSKTDFTTYDTQSPIFKEIYYENGRIFVDAYDKGGLHEDAYQFSVVGYPEKEDGFQSNNSRKALETDAFIIDIRDSDENSERVAVDIKSIDAKDGLLLKNINYSNPIQLSQGENKNLYDWLKLIKRETSLPDGDYEILENKNFIKNNNSYKLIGSGQFVLYLRDLDTGVLIGITINTKNAGYSNRTIIVDKDSEVNFKLVFKDTLNSIYGDYQAINWDILDKTTEKIDVNMFLARNYGVSTIEIDGGNSKDKELFYIVVVESIDETESLYNVEENIFPYTAMKNKTLNLNDLFFMSSNSEKDVEQYLVLDNQKDLKNDIIRNNNYLNLENKGRKKMTFLDVIKDTLTTIEFEVVELAGKIGNYIDIFKSPFRKDIQVASALGIFEENPDGRFNPKNAVTTKEFAAALNKVSLLTDSVEIKSKNLTEVNVDSRDFDYYHFLNLFIHKNNEDVSINGINPIKKGEAIILFNELLMGDMQHTPVNNHKFNDVNGDVENAVKTLQSAGIITEESDSFEPDSFLTREYLAHLVANYYNYYVED